MNQHEVEALKVGDEVGVGYNSYRDTGPKIIRVGKVDKINGHGHVKVVFEAGGPLTFTKKGNELGQERFRGHYLIEAERAHANNRNRVQQQKVNHQMRQIVSFIEGQKNGYGDYKMTPEVNEKLAELVRYLPVAP